MKCPKCGKTRISGEATVRIPCSHRDKVFFEQGKIKLVSMHMECLCGHSWTVRSGTIDRIKDEQDI
jgi:hypothetical protein